MPPSKENDINRFIETLYEVHPPEDLFRRAKEYSWQTFFHHSVSVGLIAYRIGEILKKSSSGLLVEKIRSIEENYDIPYEILLFLIGVAHDCVKLYKSKEKTGEEQIKEVIKEFMNRQLLLPRINTDKFLSKILAMARAVEGVYNRDLSEVETELIPPTVRIADILMSKRSIDEGLSYLLSAREAQLLSDAYGLKFGYVKTSSQRFLIATISEKIISILRSKGWIPLVIYVDGVLFIGDQRSDKVAVDELKRVIKKEIEEAVNLEEELNELLSNLGKKDLARIYSLLEQLGYKEIRLRDIENKKEFSIEVYYNLIAKYLNGASITEISKELKKIKEEKRIKTLIDPRSLATGVGQGSRYFSDFVATTILTGELLEKFIENVKNRDEQERYLVLAYALAFPSSTNREKAVAEVLKSLNIIVSGDEDPELLRIISIAEAYRHRTDQKKIEDFIKKAYEVSKVSIDIDHYVEWLLYTSIRSNIIDSSPINTPDYLNQVMREAKSYCRICGAPIMETVIRFIEYKRIIGEGGGASEIWLPDDIPLSDLEAISTDAKTAIRHICPLCVYEARQIKNIYTPPFLVIAFHPVVSYDLWRYLVERISYLADLYDLSQRNPRDLADLYDEQLTILKVQKTTLDKFTAPSKGRIRVLIDFLSARAFVPFGGDLSLRRKDVALALALTPIAISVSGGGQVGLVNRLGDALDLGTGQSPIVMPHGSSLVLSILRRFENIKTATYGRRQMSPDEYYAYSLSYIAIIKALYLHGLRTFAWFHGWRKKKQSKIDIRDYALKLLDYTESIPHVPLLLASPPPPSLDPRRGEGERLPYYSSISYHSKDLENLLLQVSNMSGAGEKIQINNALYRYAVNLKELKNDLSKYKVQRPLREALAMIKIMKKFTDEKDLKNLAKDRFLQLLSFYVGKDLSEKKIVEGKEISYRAIFASIFDDIADAVLRIEKELPPSGYNKVIELLLDVAYEKYRHVSSEKE